MTPHEAFAGYRQMHETTRRMLAAARDGEWEGLINLEIERRGIAERLAEPVDFRGTPLLESKDACIREILEMDGEIRSLTATWMSEMREMLGSLRTQRKVHHAYGRGSG